ETVSKGRDRHGYIPVGLFRPSDWLSPSPHPKAPPPLLLVVCSVCGLWGVCVEFFVGLSGCSTMAIFPLRKGVPSC
ncbi:Uncharacterized protein APZ42_002144, partial [Daphnia magna]